MTGPSNAVVGDLDQPTDLPQTQVPDEFLEEEKKMAKYSKSAEFKRLEDHILSRIEFYQHFLPGERPEEVGLKRRVTPEDWKVANRVIGEFRAILTSYDNARQSLK